LAAVLTFARWVVPPALTAGTTRGDGPDAGLHARYTAFLIAPPVQGPRPSSL
jgi:hypothetical protein